MQPQRELAANNNNIQPVCQPSELGLACCNEEAGSPRQLESLPAGRPICRLALQAAYNLALLPALLAARAAFAGSQVASWRSVARHWRFQQPRREACSVRRAANNNLDSHQLGLGGNSNSSFACRRAEVRPN